MASGMEMMLNMLMKNMGIKPEVFLEFVEGLKGAVAHFEQQQKAIVESIADNHAEEMALLVEIRNHQMGGVLTASVHEAYANKGLLKIEDQS